MNNQKAKLYIGIISLLVIGLVALMYSGFGLREWFDATYPDFKKTNLPFINAVLNSLVFILLLSAFRAIKQKNIPAHRRMIYTAAFLSTLFLLNYVFYHMISDSTSYGGEGFMRIFYFMILLSHVVLAVVSFPFILYTAFLGHTMQVDAHRALAKRVWPVWVYVALTGVIVYIMISPYYPVG